MRNDRRIVEGDFVSSSYRHPLVEGITRFLACLCGMVDPVAGRRVRWTPLATATAAVLMALGHHVPLRAACDDALSCMAIDFRRRRRVGGTYNGWIKAMERQSPDVLPKVKASLRQHVRQRLRSLPDMGGVEFARR